MRKAKDFIEIELKNAYKNNFDYDEIIERIYVPLCRNFDLCASAQRQITGYFDGIVDGMQMVQTDFGTYPIKFAKLSIQTITDKKEK